MPNRLWCEFSQHIAYLEKLLITYWYWNNQACVVVGSVIFGMVRICQPYKQLWGLNFLPPAVCSVWMDGRSTPVSYSCDKPVRLLTCWSLVLDSLFPHASPGAWEAATFLLSWGHSWRYGSLVFRRIGVVRPFESWVALSIYRGQSFIDEYFSASEGWYRASHIWRILSHFRPILQQMTS